jgi:hypothetical protein
VTLTATSGKNGKTTKEQNVDERGKQLRKQTTTSIHTRTERIKEESNERIIDTKQVAPTARKENGKHTDRKK